MAEILVDFDSGNSNYTLLDGTLTPSVGNPGRCIDGGKNPDQTRCEIRVNFPSPVTVSKVALDYWRNHELVGGQNLANLTRSVRLYKDDGTEIVNLYAQNIQTNNIWRTQSWPNLSYTDVGYIIFLVGAGAWAYDTDLHARMDNCVIEYSADDIPAFPSDQGGSDPDVGICGLNVPFTAYPVDLWSGEKSEHVTDLTLTSPAKTLAFTRAFRQSQIDDSNFLTDLGLGWTHNHNLNLDATSTPDMIFAYLPGGGKAHFEKVSATEYQAKPGGTSSITVDTGSTLARYTLQSTDQTFIFDDQGHLRSRQWSNGEIWTYDYYDSVANPGDPAFADGLLKSVDDGYGRQLQFSYIDNSTGFDNLRLKYIGDQTVVDIHNPIVGDRVIGFGYSENKIEDSGNPGTVIDGGEALLTSVTDVRGNTWTYTYEAAAIDTLNWLVKLESPMVDVDGDGQLDAAIVLKELIYTVSAGQVQNITQKRGKSSIDPDFLKQTDYAFQVQTDLTTETTADQVIKHLFQNGVYIGQEDMAGNQSFQLPNTNYRPMEQKDANGNSVALFWSDDGKTLDAVFDPLGNSTLFEYMTDGTDRLDYTIDAQGRKTGYIYNAGNRQPTMILVGDNVQPVAGVDIETNDNWSIVNSATKSWLNPQVDAGAHARYVNAPVNTGVESIPINLVAGRTYTFSARVYPLSGAVRMQLSGGASPFNPASSLTGDWETLSATYTPSTNESKSLQFLADGAAAEFYLDSVVVIAEQDLAVNGDMELKSNWYDVGSSSTNKQVKNPPHPVDSGSYSWLVQAVDGEGIKGEPWNLVADRLYTITARVYRDTGSVGLVKMTVPGVPELDARSTDAIGVWQTLRAVYSPQLASNNVELQFIADGGGADFYVDTVTIQEVEEIDVTGDMETAGGWTDVGTPAANERRPHADTGDYVYHVDAPTAVDGIVSPTAALTEGNTYLLLARVYPISGTVKMAVTGSAGFDTLSSSSLNQWQTLRAIHTIGTGEGGSRNIQFLADGAGTEFYVDTVHLVDLGVIAGAISEQVRWQDFRYDSRGRVVEQATVNPENAQFVQMTTRAYHLSGNGKGLLSREDQHNAQLPGDTIYTEYSYDSAGRVVYTRRGSLTGGCEASRTQYDAAGNVIESTCIPDLDFADDPIKSPVTTYGYDEMGRRVRVTTYTGTIYEQTTLTLYDALDRVIRTIQNYEDTNSSNVPYAAPGLWFWDASAGVWKDNIDDPLNAIIIEHGSENDQNLVSDTEYNERGLVRFRRDALGNVTLYGYNNADRLVKTVQSASDDTYDNSYGVGGDPDLSGYVPSADADQDIITEQAYDPAGNLAQSIDPAGRVTFTVYDALNRAVKTVRNAKDSATITLNPGDPGYDAANDPRSEGYAPSTDPARDQIQTTEYDAMGRVIRGSQLLENHVGEVWNTSLSGYDPLGRQVRAIQSAGDPDFDLSLYPDLSAYIIDNNSPDKDIVTDTVYDSDGRVMYTEDVNGKRTWFAYDGLGRGIKTIQNAVGTSTEDDEYDPRSDIYIASTEPDEDLITRTFYNSDGQVERTQDAFGRWTLNGYDNQGRRVRTIQNASDPDYIANGGLEPDTSLANYPPVSDSDQDLITDTVYDDQGRVQDTIDTRGNISRTVYSDSGRVLKTIRNYVEQGSPATDPADWYWNGSNWQQSDTDTTAIIHGADNNRNLITEQEYDLLGRVVRSRDTSGRVSFTVYDALGRSVKTVRNAKDSATIALEPGDMGYDATNDPRSASYVPDASPDRDLITQTVYNKAGQVVSTRDPRGTQTTFAYDAAGRRQTVTQAAGTALEATSYTAYDKAGRVLRTIRNYVDQNGTDPADWVWDAARNHWEDGANRLIDHGADNDQNLITDFAHDDLGRRTSTVNAEQDTVQTAYYKDGQVESLVDPEGSITKYRYDGLRRRALVVQAYEETTDPDTWSWNGTYWEAS